MNTELEELKKAASDAYAAADAVDAAIDAKDAYAAIDASDAYATASDAFAAAVADVKAKWALDDEDALRCLGSALKVEQASHKLYSDYLLELKEMRL